MSEQGGQDLALQALRWALGAYLKAEDADAAARMWERPDGQGGSALVGLSRYTRLIAQQFGLQGKEAELHLRIIRAMQSQSGTPGKWTEGAQLSEQAVAPQASPSGQLMQAFLVAVERHLGREMPDLSQSAWRQALLKQAQSLKPEPLRALSDWLWRKQDVLAGDWPAQAVGTQLINTAYVALAQWLGPVRADQCLTRVVRELEASGDANLAGIRRWL